MPDVASSSGRSFERSGARGSFVYVVSFTPSNYYDAIAAIAIASLRRSNPDARIVVVIDDRSVAHDTAAIREIRGLADEVVVQQVPFDGNTLRSRYMKTHLRRSVAGDLIYLDSDTIVLSDISELWDLDADVAAAPDLDEQGCPYVMSELHRQEYGKLGWAPIAGPHLNSGVILMRDNPAVRAMGERLIADWTRFREVAGRPNDQPVFNHAVFASGVRLAVLPLRYNAQIMSSSRVGRGAKIVHVFSGGFDTRSDTILHLAARRLRDEGVIDWALIDRAQARGHAWTELDTAWKAICARAYGRAALLGLGRVLRLR